MNSEYFIINNSGNRQKIENIRIHLPHFRIPILALALGIKSISLSDLPCLMIASNQAYTIRVPQFQKHQQSNSFYTVSSSVYIITQKQVVGVRYVSSNFKKLKDVVELSMDIAYKCNWTFQILDVVFLCKYFSYFRAYYLYNIFFDLLSFVSFF